MPTISRFYGIVIRMYERENNPPHFHALYGSFAAQIDIDPLRIHEGSLPPSAWRRVRRWAMLNRHQLRANWSRIERAELPLPITPLE